MRAKLGSTLAAVSALLLLVQTNEARADFAQCATSAGVLPDCTTSVSSCCKKSFSTATANPIVITTDRCHQPLGATPNLPGASGAPFAELSVTSWNGNGSVTLVTTSAAHGMTTNVNNEPARLFFGSFSGTYQVRTGNKCTRGSGSGNACTTSQFEIVSTVNGSGTSGTVLAFRPGNGWCVDPPDGSARIGGASTDDGMMKTYGLVYRLMQRAIPVYWIVNPTKDAIAIDASNDRFLASDVDMWVVTSDVTDPPSSGGPLTTCTTPGCTQPVHHLSSTLVASTDSYRAKEFPMRGGAFVIAGEDRANFNAFWNHTGAYASLAADTRYAWASSGIDLYEIDATAKFIHQNYSSGNGTTSSKFTTLAGAPIAVKIDYAPPRVACLGCGSANPTKFLQRAGLADPPTDTASCLTGQFVPSDAVYCQLSDTDVANGALVNGGFAWAWVFGLTQNVNAPCADSSQKAVFDRLRDFQTTLPAIRNAGHSIYLDSAVKISEGCANKQLMGVQGSGLGLTLQNAQSEPYIIRYPSNLFMQWGDIAPSFASGTIGGWSGYDNAGSPKVRYQSSLAASGSTLRRLASVDTSTTCILHTSTGTCDLAASAVTQIEDSLDVAAYSRLGNVLANGLTYYLPGNQLDNNGNTPELRMLLNSLIAIPDETYTATYEATEIARTQPVVASLDGGTTDTVFVPTYVRQYSTALASPPPIPKATTTSGLSRFTFPYIEGHLRAIPATAYSKCTDSSCLSANTSRTGFSAMTNTFDVASNIPAASSSGCSTPFNGACRTVFTNTASGRLPARVYFTDSDANMTGTLGTYLSTNLTTAEKKTLVSRILAGYYNGSTWSSKLGGVDHSTPAVIPSSTLVPRPSGKSSDRPTMIYFGATDGMIHAACATVNSEYGCDVAGRELWAFIPRTVLSNLKQSVANIEGSPHVIDAYGNFDNTGNAWRTIMLFATGTGDMTSNNVVPAVYAIDVTQPDNPKILWEYAVTNVASRGSTEMGVATTLMAGPVLSGGTRYNYVWVQSNNGGTGGAGSVVTAINVEDGTKVWQVGDIYPTSSGNSARDATHEAAPASGVPGGVVGFDKTGNNYYTHIVYGTLYGDVYIRDAVTGANQNSTVPAFRFANDYKPIGTAPAIFKDSSGKLYAAFASGGYVDTQATLWRGANEATPPTQMAFAVSLDYVTATSLTDATSVGTNIPFHLTFTANTEGAFAQPVVLGTELFFITDTTNVNVYDYGSYSTPTGRMYRLDIGGSAFKTGVVQDGTTKGYTVIAGGAASVFNTGTKLLTAGGQFGEAAYFDATTVTGSKVDLQATATTSTRKLWLRTE